MVTQLGVAIGIISVFLVIGSLLPFIQSDFPTTTYNTGDINTQAQISAQELNSVNALSVIGSIAKMFFWTFGDFGTGLLGVIIETVFLIMRITLIAILIQYLPFVG